MKPIFAALLFTLALGLSGCGNKGPLVLPTAPAADVPPLDAPADADPTPETLNDANTQPPQGEGSESGGSETPPVPSAR